jgi:hypothetical protein
MRNSIFAQTKVSLFLAGSVRFVAVAASASTLTGCGPLEGPSLGRVDPDIGMRVCLARGKTTDSPIISDFLELAYANNANVCSVSGDDVIVNFFLRPIERCKDYLVPIMVNSRVAMPTPTERGELQKLCSTLVEIVATRRVDRERTGFEPYVPDELLLDEAGPALKRMNFSCIESAVPSSYGETSNLAYELSLKYGLPISYFYATPERLVVWWGDSDMKWRGLGIESAIDETLAFYWSKTGEKYVRGQCGRGENPLELQAP